MCYLAVRGNCSMQYKYTLLHIGKIHTYLRKEIGIINPRLSVAPGARPTHHGFLPETKTRLSLSLYVGVVMAEVCKLFSS